jgi:hypothetical protein
VRKPDWPFGSAVRRRALQVLLLEEEPEKGWSTRSLERAAGVERTGLDKVLRGAADWKLIELNDRRRWKRVVPEPSIAAPLRDLLTAVRSVADEPMVERPSQREG